MRDYVHGRIGHLPAREVSPGEIVEIVERSGEKSLPVARLVLIALREVFAHGVARHVVATNPCAHIKAKAVIGAPPSRQARIMLNDAEIERRQTLDLWSGKIIHARERLKIQLVPLRRAANE